MQILLLIFSAVILIGCLAMLIAIWRTSDKPQQAHGDAKSRERFISIISHQLRTPLSIVRGYLESLESGDMGPINDKQKEYVTEAGDMTKNMIAMVNMYLEVLTKDQSAVVPVITKIDVIDLINKLVDRFGMYGRATNVEIVAKLPKKPILVATDERMVRGVFENILSNAIKYTIQAGTVTVTYADQGRFLDFSIADTGIGIPANEQKELFSRFFRASNIVHRSIAGSGLGLYVSKEHMRALGGDITFTSTVGKGTTMHVLIPKKK